MDYLKDRKFPLLSGISFFFQEKNLKNIFSLWKTIELWHVLHSFIITSTHFYPFFLQVSISTIQKFLLIFGESFSFYRRLHRTKNTFYPTDSNRISEMGKNWPFAAKKKHGCCCWQIIEAEWMVPVLGLRPIPLRYGECIWQQFHSVPPIQPSKK